MTSLIVVSEPPGVGTTTVAWEMVDVLEEEHVPFGFYVARAQELEAHRLEHPVEDFLVETDNRGVRDIALEVLTRSGWI